MKKGYGTIKYRGYIIEGCGNYYELYHPDGLIGKFKTCKEAKSFVDWEKERSCEIWNNKVMSETI